MHTLDAKTISHLPSMLWARTIQHYLGGISYGKIQKQLIKGDEQTNADFWEKCSGRLYKNSRGKTRVRDVELINQVENLLPGTKRILHHPLWKIMANPDADLTQVYNYMDELPLDLKNALFKVNYPDSTLTRKKLKSKTVYYISKRNDLDGLACLLLMIREAELLRRIDAYIHCKWEAHQLFCRLATFAPLKSMASLVYDLIFKIFIEKNNPLPDELSNFLVTKMPQYYRLPSKYPLPSYLNQNTGILELAISLGVITQSMDDQLNFLFWIDYGIKRTQVFKALYILDTLHKTGKPPSQYPPPLDNLIEKLHGDSRKFIKGESYNI